MLIIFISLSLISIILLTSVRFLKKRFDTFEIFLILMFTSYNCQNFFYLLSSPYKHLRVVEHHLPFWSARIHYGVILPILLFWVMYVLRGNQKITLKVTVCLLWITCGVLIDKLLLTIGVLESQSKTWYPSVDLVIGMVVLSSSIYFMEIVPKILINEKVIRDEGDI